MSEEEWRAVPGLEGLEASTMGRVRKRGKLAKTHIRYCCQCVTFKCREYPVHQLVAAAFLGFQLGYFCRFDASTTVVHHKNWDVSDNSLENLEVVTKKEQIRLLRERFKQECLAYYKNYSKKQ